MSGLTIAHILTVFMYSAAAADGTIAINMTGGESISGVRAVIKGNLTFLSLDDVSAKLGIVSKDIGGGAVGLCKGDLCIPVELNNRDDVRRDSGFLMINANLIAQAFNSSPQWLVYGKILRFVPADQVILDTLMKEGDVVPDFVLPSISDGKLMPFSSFRGKRVLLFLWASW